VLVRYLATLPDSIAANIRGGPAVLAGYLVTGLGDAIGEPIGTMFGTHRYRVRSRSSVPATRGLEGSAAGFLMSVAALLLAAAVSLAIVIAGFGFATVLFIAAICAVVEAISPHGWDNLTLQAVPTVLVWLWLAPSLRE
jgi:phytol kinase